MDELVCFERLCARLRIRQLRLLAEIGTVGSVHAAAKRVAMSQPAASQALREIESLVGLSLFERSARGMVPTPAGRVLIAHARGSMRSLYAATQSLAALDSDAGAPLRIGALSGAISAIVEPALEAASADEIVALSVVEDNAFALLEGLTQGAYDLLLIPEPAVLSPGLAFDALVDDRIAVVVAPTHPLARRRRLALADLEPFRWALPPRAFPTGQAVHLWLARRDLRPRQLSVDTNAPGLMPALLRATDSVALLPASYLTRLIRDGRLRELAVPEVDVPLGRLGALYFQGREHPRLARWLASARQALAKAPGQHHRARARSCVQ